MATGPKATPRSNLNLLLAVLVIAVVVGVFILPSMETIRRHQKSITALRTEWATTQELIQEYRKLKSAQPGVIPLPPNQTLLQFVEESARNSGIPAESVQPKQIGGETEMLNLELEDVPGDSLVRFLHKARLYGLKTDRFRMQDQDGDGLWSVTMIITAPETTPTGGPPSAEVSS